MHDPRGVETTASAGIPLPRDIPSLGTLLDHAPVGILVVDTLGRLLTWNARAAAMVHSDDSAMGRPVADLFATPAAVSHAIAAAAIKASPIGTAASAAVVVEVHAGHDLALELTTVRSELSTGEPIVLAILLDVSARRAVEDARDSLNERLAMLALVSESLASADDPDEAVGRLARLVIPQLGDWSFVTVIDEDGTLRDLALAHVDPARDGDLLAYSAQHLQNMSEVAAVSTALRTGEVVVVPHLDDAMLDSFLPDEVVAGLTRRLDPYGVAVFPLTARGRTFGVLTCVTTSARGSHTPDQIATGTEVARRAGPVLDAARSGRRASRLAETIQRSLLTVAEPHPALRVSTRYRPAFEDREVGGDWYDVFALADGATMVSIGDVMGHDVAAITAMSQLRTLMRANAWTLQHSPAQILSTTDTVSARLGPGTFATAVMAEIRPPADDGTFEVRWSNAGHLPPALLSSDGTVTLLRGHSSDIPLGVLPARARHNHRVTVDPGSVLVLYTDGLIERRDEDIETGLALLAELISSTDARDIDTIPDLLISKLLEAGPQHDDVALVAVRLGQPQLRQVVAPTRRSRLELPFGPEASALARAWLRERCAQLPDDVLSDAQVLVSELVTNALRYGDDSVAVDLRTTHGRLRIEVHDAEQRVPVLASRVPDGTAQSGRGLLIVDALAAAWGVHAQPQGRGKTVWFELAVPES